MIAAVVHRQAPVITLGLFAALVLTLLGLAPVRMRPGEEVVVPQGSSKRPVGAIAQGVTVEQQFPAPREEIQAVSILLVTYQRANVGTLRLTLQAESGGQWRSLATQSVRKEALRDNAYHTFTFSPPVALRDARQLALTLQSDSTSDNAISWWANGTWRPPGFLLLVNGEPQPGAAVFKLTYKERSGRLWWMAPYLWQRVTIFLDPFWQGMLLFGLGLAASTFAFYLARRG